jgi:hypothetical protein
MVTDGEPCRFDVRGTGIYPALMAFQMVWVNGGGFDMDSTTIIRIVAGVLFVVVLVVLIQRRRTRTK